MTLITIILIAIGLAMDCFAVSVCKGMASAHSTGKADLQAAYRSSVQRPILMAVLFGVFQGGMPLIGYFAGTLFADFFHRFAPWIALTLLSFLGIKMIIESFKPDSCDSHSADFGIILLLTLAVATSIDALATGVIFIPHSSRLWIGVGIIALVSFLFSIAGYVLGFTSGKKLRINHELLGGIILILIGIKICLEGIL